MPGMFPVDSQPRQGRADAAQADPLPVLFSQVLVQQGGGPHARVVAMIAGILANYFINQRIDNSLHRRRSAGAHRIQNPLRRREPAPLLEAVNPVVNGLTGNMQVFRHFLHALTLIQ